MSDEQLPRWAKNIGNIPDGDCTVGSSPMSELESAAERLKRCKAGEQWKIVYGYGFGFTETDRTYEQNNRAWEAAFVAKQRDEELLAEHYLRLTDPRLVDEQFAKSLGARDDNGWYLIGSTCYGNAYLISSSNNRWKLLFVGRLDIWEPTIGHVYLAAKMFDVTLKEVE